MNVARYFVMCLSLICSLAAGGSAAGQITFDLTFNDVVNNTNVGFDDPVLGVDRQNTLNAVVGYLNTVIDGNGTLNFVIADSETDGTGSLASAGSLYFPAPNRFAEGLVFTDAMSTPALFPFAGGATFDFGYSYNSQTDAPTAMEYDLYTIALHEFTHALGFVSLANIDDMGDMDPTNDTVVSVISGGDPGVYSTYDSFVQRGDGTNLFAAGGDYVGTAADLRSGDLFFSGPNAIAANGGNPVQLHAPTMFELGSSVSHLDFSTDPGAALEPSVATGVAKRTYSDVELGILEDLGYTLQVPVIPEPSSMLLMLAAASIGMCRRNRK